MDNNLDFSLPQKKQKASALLWTIIVLLLVLVGLAGMDLLFRFHGPMRAQPAAGLSSLSPVQTRELAMKLAARSLFGQAARAWQDYLATAQLTDAERAKVFFEIGTLLEKAGSDAEAIECFYKSELASKIDELEPQINLHIKDCFEKLGKFSALRYEIADRTSFKKAAQAGDKVVAEIGDQKFTQADIDAKIENSIENQLQSVSGLMTAEQVSEQKKKALEETADPEHRRQFLQNWLAQEVLYRRALEEQLQDKPEIKQLLAEMQRGVLSQFQLNHYLAGKINLTRTDFETYYSANKAKYVDPAGARISHILVESEQVAKDVIGKIKAGEDFAKLAKEFSKDAATKDDGGKINFDVHPGSPIPVIGDANAIADKIFAADAGSVLESPFKTEKGWEVVRVDTKTPQRQKNFDEVKDQVESTLWSQKRQEIQQQYIREMMDKYNVVIHSSAITDANKTQK
jgi:foldase protein PrsA